jgi:hypothetical protein
MNDLVKETIRQIKAAKIVEPSSDQRIERCQWSRTGWAVVESDGRCTCQPAKAPTPSPAQSNSEAR